MADVPADLSMVEEREELMVSPTGGNPFLRKAHFLKPTWPFSSINENVPPFKLPPPFAPSKNNFPLNVQFRGWQRRVPKMRTWVDQMAAVHHLTWRKAGIYEAIFNSTYKIKRQNDLVYGLAEKWCCETNTFIFPWGEATITLEDVMLLGGFPVLGDSVLSPLETTESKEIEAKLNGERNLCFESGRWTAKQSEWMNMFMNSGSELEHEAFLAYWLSRYVFPGASDKILKHSLPIAIHLARGTRIALAPAVLASIYRDLGLFKKRIVASTQLKIGDAALVAIIKSPFQLVQVWAWERFLKLRPKPNAINSSDIRMARWDKINGLKVDNLRMVLDSAGEDFKWRPYAVATENWYLPKCYPQQEKWVLVSPDLGGEILSFVRCLRVSKLVGLDTIEHFLPHRVARQFGFDQDIPCSVTLLNHNPAIAWEHYIRDIKNVKFYLPSRLFEPDVSIKYLQWWKQSVSSLEDAREAVVPQNKKARSTDWSLLRANHPLVPPCFPPKCSSLEAGDPKHANKPSPPEFLKYCMEHECVENRQDGDFMEYECVENRQDDDFMEFSDQAQNLASPIAEGSSVNAMKSDKGLASMVGNECSSSSSLIEKRLLELEKRDAVLKARFEKIKSVVAELKTNTELLDQF